MLPIPRLLLLIPCQKVPTTGCHFVASATRAGERFVRMCRGPVYPSASGPPQGRRSKQKRQLQQTHGKNSTTSQRRLINRHLKRFFCQRHKKKVPEQNSCVRREGLVSNNRDYSCGKKRCAAPDCVMSGPITISVSLTITVIRWNGK